MGMGANCRQETCYICNCKVKIENETSQELENHYNIHKDELARIRFSNEMKDVVRTRCLMCEEDNPVVLSRLRAHTKIAHGLPLSEYKKRFNIATERDHVLVETILHKCGLCGVPLLLCSDVIAVHIKRHKITHANYNATFMNLMQKSPLAANDVKKEKKVSTKRRRSNEPLAPSIASVPFQPSMILTGEEALQLDLSLLSSASLSHLFSPNEDLAVSSNEHNEQTLQENSYNDMLTTSKSTASTDDVSNEAAEPHVAIDKFKTNIHKIINKSTDQKSSRNDLKEITYNKKPKLTFQDQLRSKLSKVKTEPATREGNQVQDSLNFSEPSRSSQGSSVDDFSNVLDKVYQNFATKSETNNHTTNDPLGIDADQSLDNLISNIWA